MSCKRSKECDNADICQFAQSDDYHLLGGSCYRPKKPQTNEEWFTSLSTEEKARFLDKICYSAWGDKNSRFKDMADYTDWLEWLKEKHNG